jgi:hypothetical protein
MVSVPEFMNLVGFSVLVKDKEIWRMIVKKALSLAMFEFEDGVILTLYLINIALGRINTIRFFILSSETWHDPLIVLRAQKAQHIEFLSPITWHGKIFPLSWTAIMSVYLWVSSPFAWVKVPRIVSHTFACILLELHTHSWLHCSNFFNLAKKNPRAAWGAEVGPLSGFPRKEAFRFSATLNWLFVNLAEQSLYDCTNA